MVVSAEKRFWLFENVTITTKNSRRVTGEIVYISETSVDILPDCMSVQTIKLADIENVTYLA